MIYEIARIKVRAGTATEFESAVNAAIPLFRRARGCRAMQLQRRIEQADTYTLVVAWETLDDHMIHFRQSADFQAWRSLVGPYFDGLPEVHHTEVVLEGWEA